MASKGFLAVIGAVLLSIALAVAAVVIAILLFIKVQNATPVPPTVAPSAPAATTPMPTNPSTAATAASAGTTKPSSGTTTSSTARPTISYNNNPLWMNVSQMFASSIDTSFDPCTDFYHYACNNWIKSHPIPSYADSVISFDYVNEGILQALGAGFSKGNSNGSYAIQQTLLAFNSCMKAQQGDYSGADLVTLINQYGGWPIIQKNWAPNNQYSNVSSLMGTLAGQYGIPTILTPIIDTDWKYPVNQLLYIDQSTLLYPTIFYTTPSIANKLLPSIQSLIQGVATAVCNLTNTNFNCNSTQMNADISDMMNLEMILANLSVPDALRRNYSQQYNLYGVQSASSQYPLFNWRAFLTQLAIGAQIDPSVLTGRNFGMVEPGFVAAINTRLASITPRVFQNYLIWRLIYTQLDFLPTFQGILLEFKRNVHGVQALLYNRDVCTSNVINYLPWPAGRVYIDSHFSKIPNARTMLQSMVTSVMGAFRVMLSQLTWMSEPTKAIAISKVNQIIQNVAYPDWIMNNKLLDAQHPSKYLNISPTDKWYTAQMKLNQFASWSQFVLLLNTTDRTNFLSSPAIVNAWYQPELNSISFPAGILNPPFFHPQYPLAVNYGAMGVVMGHELTHGFDDEGVQWDGVGTLNSWIDPQSDIGFKQMATCVVNEYSNFTFSQLPLPNNVNGFNTQGENIADNGGIKAAYIAFKTAELLNGDDRPLPPPMNTFTWDQIFFLSFGQVWCRNVTDEALRVQLLTDPHSPARDRVWGTVQNFPAFARAFNCPLGKPMNPVKACNVW